MTSEAQSSNPQIGSRQNRPCIYKLKSSPSRFSDVITSIARYLAVSVVTYVFLLSVLFALVDMWGLKKVPAYVIAYGAAYFLEYTSTLLFVFKGEHHWLKVLKFCVYVGGFLVLSTVIFDALVSQGVHYLVAPLVTSISLMPARYLVNRLWVYR